MTYLTTSWDDGHAFDSKLADMLARHELPATFYVPRECEGRSLLGRNELKQLAQGFELGAHTLTHSRLTMLSDAQAAAEISGSRKYVEDLTGRKCTVFAPPGGKFKRVHLGMAATAGLRGFRTTELLDYGRPRQAPGIVVMPTTLQAYLHPASGYFRNALRRMRPGHLLTWMRYGRQGSLISLFCSLLDRAIVRGGVIHLWGHSWEIEEQCAWPMLETMLAEISRRRSHLRLVTNSTLCAEVA